MTEIVPPARLGDYVDRRTDGDLALEPAFQSLANQAEAAGWTEVEVAASLLALAANHIKGIVEDRKTQNAIDRAATLPAGDLPSRQDARRSGDN